MWKRQLAFLLALCICMIVVMTGCQDNTDNPGPSNDPSGDKELVETSKYPNLYVDETPVNRNDTGITWEQGQALPAFAPVADKVYGLDVTSGDTAKKIMLASFAGVINKTKPRVMLYTADEKAEGWYEKSNTNVEVVKNTDGVIEQFKDEIKGVIVWDTKEPATMHLAATHAGIEGAIVVNKKQMETYTAEPYNFPVIADYRNQFKNELEVYQYIYDNLWSKCSHRLLAGPKLQTHDMVDLVVGANLAAVWFDVRDAQHADLLAKFLKDMTPGESYYIGWWSAEGTGVTFASNYGVATVPADYYNNYSFHSGASRQLDAPTVPAKPQLENKIYVAFVLSDGDNTQYVQHTMGKNTNLWASKKRGDIAITWTCSPSLMDAGPQILNYFYKTASDNDCIISGPSGFGYTYPTDWNTETAGMDALTKYAQKTNSYFWRSGFRVITVWSHLNAEEASVYAKNMRCLTGVGVQSFGTGQGPDYQFTVDGRLAVSATLPKYEKQTDQVLNLVKAYAKAKYDGSKPCFIMPQLVSWNLGVSDILSLGKKLQKEYGDSIEFVRADHLMMLYSEYSNTPYNVVLQNANVTASGSDDGYDISKVVDGSFSKGWQCSSDEKWLQVDLGATYTINRYVLQNAGLAYAPADQNTIGFKLQASTDGVNWTDIDVVTANKSNVVDKDVDAFTAQYVRVEITNAGSDGVARIQELELYGNKVA